MSKFTAELLDEHRRQFLSGVEVAVLNAPTLPHRVRDMRGTPIRERPFCPSIQSIAKSLGVAYVIRYEYERMFMRRERGVQLLNASPEQKIAFLAGQIVPGLTCLEEVQGVVRGKYVE